MKVIVMKDWYDRLCGGFIGFTIAIAILFVLTVIGGLIALACTIISPIVVAIAAVILIGGFIIGWFKL